MTIDPSPAPTGRALAGHWLPVALYIALIFSLSSLHGDQVPSLFPNVDKLEHFMEYGLLGLLLGRAVRFTLRGRSSGLAALATVTVGATVALFDELYQLRVPGRMSDPMDWATDVVAVGAAVLFTRFVHVRSPGRRRRGAGDTDPLKETGDR
jgi:VanZ family protein